MHHSFHLIHLRTTIILSHEWLLYFYGFILRDSSVVVLSLDIIFRPHDRSCCVQNETNCGFRKSLANFSLLLNAIKGKKIMTNSFSKNTGMAIISDYPDQLITCSHVSIVNFQFDQNYIFFFFTFKHYWTNTSQTNFDYYASVFHSYCWLTGKISLFLERPRTHYWTSPLIRLMSYLEVYCDGHRLLLKRSVCNLIEP